MDQNDFDKVKFTEWANFIKNKKQMLAHEVSKIYDVLGYGGAMGGGKSYWLRREVLYWVMYFYKTLGLKVTGAIFCEDYPALQDRQIAKIVEEFPRSIGHYKASDPVYGRCFRLSEKYGGGVIALRNLDDPGKYDSSEFAVIGIDQGEKNPVRAFNVLRRRNRWPGIVNCKFFVTANPGGELWFEQYFIDREFPPEEEEMDKFHFVQALPADNPFLSEEYWIKLRSMPPAERRAYEQGDWKAFAQEMDMQGYLKLLTPQEVNSAYIDQKFESGQGILGVDPGAGVDESAIVKKTDTLERVLFNQKLADTMALVGLIVNFLRKEKCNTVVVDITGIGYGIVNRLNELKRANRWKIDIYGVSFGQSPRDKKRFADCKAEMYWNQREWVLRGGKLFRDVGFEELKVIKYKKNSSEKILIQPKDEMRKAGIKSPNVADAAALTHYIPQKTIDNKRILAGREFHDNTLDIWRQ